MSDWLSKYIGIKVITADNYETCVARGIGNVLEHFDILQNGDYEFRTLQDAKEYLYSFSTRRRVYKFQDIKVNLYI